MKEYGVITAMAMVAGVIMFLVVNDPVVKSSKLQACTDGSYVGRTGPNCEFAACPTYDTGIR